MTHTASRAAKRHVWKLVGVGMLLFGALVAIPIGMPHQNEGGVLGWLFTIGIFMVAAGVFIMAAYIDRAIRRHKRRFYEGT